MVGDDTHMKHAIVIGGSVGGLLAARVLAGYFERVTIVERDRFPAIGEQRRGVPQGRHTNGLLARRRQRSSTRLGRSWSATICAWQRQRGRATPSCASSTGIYRSFIERAHRDPSAAEAFLRVSNFLAAPPSVFHPKVAIRVLKWDLTRRFCTA